jgi:hypothetical protein
MPFFNRPEIEALLDNYQKLPKQELEQLSDSETCSLPLDRPLRLRGTAPASRPSFFARPLEVDVRDIM